MIAKGIDIYGKEHEFECSNGTVWHCHNKQLISLILPEGVEEVWCDNNKLTELTLPDSVEYLSADKEVTGLEKYMGKVTMDLF